MKDKHSKVKGNLGQLKIAANLIELGFEVFSELGDNSKIDLIAVDVSDYRPYKIQIKTISVRNGSVHLTSKKSGPNYKFRYKPNQVDIFAIYVLGRNLILYVKADNILTASKKCLTIRVDKPKNKQTKRVNWFHQYLDLSEILRGHTRSVQTFAEPAKTDDDMVQTASPINGC